MSGVLYVVATPIGNLEDITFRAVRVLGEADIIAAEDTRQTVKLLNRYEIKTGLMSYHEHNKTGRGNKILELLLEGKNVALVTDAGMPCISDPGYELVRLCSEHGVHVVAVPGASASISALAVSGISSARFAFEGFLPREKKPRRELLKSLENETRTLIFYESPHRVRETLSELHEALGDRRCSVARELTKVHEEILRGTLAEIREHFDKTEPKGEFTIVVEGLSLLEKTEREAAPWLAMSVEEHVQFHISHGLAKMDAIKLCAKQRNVPKREVYNCIENE